MFVYGVCGGQRGFGYGIAATSTRVRVFLHERRHRSDRRSPNECVSFSLAAFLLFGRSARGRLSTRRTCSFCCCFIFRFFFLFCFVAAAVVVISDRADMLLKIVVAATRERFFLLFYKSYLHGKTKSGINQLYLTLKRCYPVFERGLPCCTRLLIDQQK